MWSGLYSGLWNIIVALVLCPVLMNAVTNVSSHLHGHNSCLGCKKEITIRLGTKINGQMFW